MKYGEHLKNNIAPEYGAENYLDYTHLDHVIYQLSDTKPSSAVETSRVISMTSPPQTNAQGLDTSNVKLTGEDFLLLVDSEIAKVEKFTLGKVNELRDKIKVVESAIQAHTITSTGEFFGNRDEIKAQAEMIADDFLRLEKYVNLNFMGFHKILKKHDKNLPTMACKQFYVNRLHNQAWVRGDYSDIVVQLSKIYSVLREDSSVEEEKKSTPDRSVLRSTKKYWVKTEDVSRVKYTILRHLPVLLQRASTGESDSQLTNSVYLDNDQLELYHGRLDKAPGSISLRLRWYETTDPEIVYVERKTHNDKWAGSVSVKERFMVKESEVQQILTNTYPIQEKKEEMLARGTSQKEADEWETLVREVTQIIASKQLVPTMRTQFMRTAFQIPFDSTVRVSLDTHVCMVSERGYDVKNMSVWHRDKKGALSKSDINRFPHAVLEIKLELTGGNKSQPTWVTDLLNSGMVYECHMFSKNVHGCAVLLPEDVQYVPYWVDDVSLRQSLEDSGARHILDDEDAGKGLHSRQNSMFGSTIDKRSDSSGGRTSAMTTSVKGFTETAPLMNNQYKSLYISPGDKEIETDDEDEVLCGWFFPFCSRNNQLALSAYEDFLPPKPGQRIEPKNFFAAERTFLHWLHHGVILSTISSAILSFSKASGETWGEFYALLLMPIALGFCIYAVNTFLWRIDRLKHRIPTRWDDTVGPFYFGCLLAVVLLINFVLRLCLIAKLETSPPPTM